jgi:hypothetical protein
MMADSIRSAAIVVLLTLAGCGDGRERVETNDASATAVPAPPFGTDSASDAAPPTADASEWSQAPGGDAPPSGSADRPQLNSKSDQPAASRDALAKGAEPLSEADRERYTRVAASLVTAINAEDRVAYRALHTDEGWNTAIDWWQNMFAMQTSKWGRIDRAWPPTRGVIRVGGIGFRGDEGERGATVMIHFEEGVGGALTFALDENDKIRSTSVFIKEELGDYAPAGVTPIFELSGGE